MSTRDRKRSTRLAIPPEYRLPPLTDTGGDVFEGPASAVRTLTTYWDTEDLRLVRAGASLHHTDNGWRIALPLPGAAGDDTGPAALRPDGGPDRPPTTAVDLVTALTRGAELQAVATLRTTQRRVPITAADGTPVASVVD